MEKRQRYKAKQKQRTKYQHESSHDVDYTNMRSSLTTYQKRLNNTE